jgi:ABC-type Na+ transport system ATPase subunit NatA
VVQIPSTLIAADRCEIQIAGHDLTGDPDAVRAAIGVTGQCAGLALLALLWAGRLYGNREQLVR